MPHHAPWADCSIIRSWEGEGEAETTGFLGRFYQTNYPGVLTERKLIGSYSPQIRMTTALDRNSTLKGLATPGEPPIAGRSADGWAPARRVPCLEGLASHHRLALQRLKLIHQPLQESVDLHPVVQPAVDRAQVQHALRGAEVLLDLPQPVLSLARKRLGHARKLGSGKLVAEGHANM